MKGALMDESRLDELRALLALDTEDDDAIGGSTEDLARRYRLVLDAQAELDNLHGALQEELAARMDSDAVRTAAGWLVRTPTYSSQWIDDESSTRFRKHIANAVTTAVAVDYAT